MGNDLGHGEKSLSIRLMMFPFTRSSQLFHRNLLIPMPKKLILSTGLDALSHAMEAFWARPSTAIVKDVAVIAMIRIKQNLKIALDNPLDKQARSGLARGSTLAGMAFSNTRTTACHSMSYPYDDVIRRQSRLRLCDDP